MGRIASQCVPERFFLSLPRVTLMVSSMIVSFGGGFAFSVCKEGNASICIGSSSAGVDWLDFSDAAVAVSLFELVAWFREFKSAASVALGIW